VLWAGTGGQSAVSRLLSNPVLVQIGKMSYSLYLWHWPLLLLVSKYIDAGLPQSTVSAVVALTLSFPISYASWRWVENPFRHGSTSQRGVFAVAGSLTMMGAMTGALLIFNGERLTWWSEGSMAMLDVHKPPKQCFGMAPEHEICRVGTGEPTVAIWGDSHAHALLPAFQAIAERDGWSAKTYLTSACPPLIGVVRVGDAKGCTQANDEALAQIADSSVETVILAGRWALSAEGSRPENSQDPVMIYDSQPGPSDNRAVFERGVERTVAALEAAGKRIVFVGGMPEYPWNVPNTAGLRRHLSRERPSLSLREAAERNAFVDDLMSRLPSEDGELGYVPLVPRLCDQEECRQLVDGRPAYTDSNHISVEGATWLAGRLPSFPLLGARHMQ